MFPPMVLRRTLMAAVTDVRLQARYGLYLAGGLTAVLVGLGLAALGLRNPEALLPAALQNNMVLSSFYFMAGLVLFERDEGTLAARGPTPLRPGEYLAARLLTLALLNVLEGIGILLLAIGPGFAMIQAALGLAVTSTIFGLFGFIAVARFQSFNTFLLPSVLIVAVMDALLPIDLAGWWHPLLALHPIAGALLLLHAAFAPVDTGMLALSLITTLLWLAGLSMLALRAYTRMQTGDSA